MSTTPTTFLMSGVGLCTAVLVCAGLLVACSAGVDPSTSPAAVVTESDSFGTSPTATATVTVTVAATTVTMNAAPITVTSTVGKPTQPERSETPSQKQITNSGGRGFWSLFPQDRLVPRGDYAAMLSELPVKGRAPHTGYERNLFGKRWSDDVKVEYGHNGCDTRNDILRRDLDETVLKPGTKDCVVLSGKLFDPYTGKEKSFKRGVGTSALIQIDHVVPLGNAWVTGAFQWDPHKRRNFANDPLNLLAVDGEANQKKRDGDAATWLPPFKPGRCGYAKRIIAVKHGYGLWTTNSEHDALARLLSQCPSDHAFEKDH